MCNVPKGIQYIQSKNHGTKYTLSRLYSKQGRDIGSTSKKKISDEEKFLEILKLYQENCIKEKQNETFMKINIDDYKKYVPNK